MFAYYQQRFGLWALALGLAAGAWASFAAEPTYEETAPKKGWHLFLRAHRDNPADQLRYVKDLQKQGKFKAAANQGYALRIFWSNAPEAPEGQMIYAEWLEGRGNLLKAFDAYQYIVEHYPARYDFEDLIGRQFRIAKTVMDLRKGKFFIFPGFDAPERAIPLFEKVIASAPRWTHTAEAQYLIGKANERIQEYELAVVAYMATENRYPQSAFAEKAGYGRTYCFYQLALENPYDERTLEEAWASILLFQKRYPVSQELAVVQEYGKVVYRLRAKNAYDRAYYYDHVAKKPAAALIEYETLTALFPHSDWTELAKARIETLKPLVKKDANQDK